MPPDLPPDCTLYRAWLAPDQADTLLRQCLDGIPWESNTVTIRGKIFPMPRLTWYCGTHDYAYSGHTHPAQPTPNFLVPVQRDIENLVDGASFNAILFNLYRGGDDSLGWHSDSEPVLGRDPLVVSLSLGGERIFKMRSKTDKSEIYGIPLGHGDLLVMGGSTQHNYLHAISRTRKPVDERISLTFRRIQHPSTP